jgi:hypothetical protein
MIIYLFICHKEKTHCDLLIISGLFFSIFGVAGLPLVILCGGN